MKRIAMMTAMAMAVLVSAGITRAAAQESVSPAPASPVEGGKAVKSKTMTAVGDVRTVAPTALAINDGAGKDWTFVVDPKTKVLPGAGQETLAVGTVSPVEGGKTAPTKPAPPGETVDVAPVSPVEGGKVISTRTLTIADIKTGQRVQVTYRTVDGRMHATQIRVM